MILMNICTDVANCNAGILQQKLVTSIPFLHNFGIYIWHARGNINIITMPMGDKK